MSGERGTTQLDVLRDCWSRWTTIVSLFAGNSPARRRLDASAYAALRNELIASCRSLALADDSEPLLYAGLEETVKPWLNLRVLDQTDREILRGLLQHCRDVESKLYGRQSRRTSPLHWKPVMAIGGGGAVIGGLVGLLSIAERLVVPNTLRFGQCNLVHDRGRGNLAEKFRNRRNSGAGLDVYRIANREGVMLTLGDHPVRGRSSMRASTKGVDRQRAAAEARPPPSSLSCCRCSCYCSSARLISRGFAMRISRSRTAPETPRSGRAIHTRTPRSGPSPRLRRDPHTRP